jgi:hypothetical protein
LYQATRRNSHVHADARDNHQRTGAVLLHRTDVGNLSEFDEIKGNISIDISVTKYDQWHPDVVNLWQQNLPASTEDMEFKVCFIYLNHSVHGRRNDAEFWFA